MTSTSNKLPFELIEEVLSHIDNKPTLSACSQTSTWLRGICQRRIFASVDLLYVAESHHDSTRYTVGLEDVDETSSNLKFLSAIVSNPILETYVHTLTIKTTAGSFLTTPERGSSLLRILPRLTHLRRFSFVPNDTRPSVGIFSNLGDSFQNVVRSTLERSKDIYLVRLASFTLVPIAVVASAASVKHLFLPSFSSVNNEDLPTGPTNINTIHPNLLNLTKFEAFDPNYQLNNIIQILEMQNPMLSLSQLKTLHVSTPCGSSALLQKLFRYLNPNTLQDLYLVCPHDTMQLHSNFYDHLVSTTIRGQPLNLTSFKELKHIHLFAAIRSCKAGDDVTITEMVRDGAVVTPLRWLASVIEDLVGNESEPNLTVEITCEINVTTFTHIEEIPWRYLTEVLTRRKSDFKKVDVRLTIEKPERSSNFYESARSTLLRHEDLDPRTLRGSGCSWWFC